MSAPTTTSRHRRPGTPRGPQPTLGRAAAAEWTKLTSLRSSWWVAAVTVVLAGATTYLGAQASSGDPGFQPLGSLTVGLLLAQLGPLVLGVLVGAGEFRTGAFRTTFAVVPRRWTVLAAQTLVLAGFVLLVSVLATGASVLGLLPAARSRGIPLDPNAGETPGVLLGMVLLLPGLALLGQALGALLRRTVPALVVTLGLLVVLPIVLGLASDPLLGGADPASLALPDEIAGTTTVLGTLEALTPLAAGLLMTVPASATPVAGAPDLGPVGGGLVLGAWVAVLLAAAAVRLRAQDLR